MIFNMIGKSGGGGKSSGAYIWEKHEFINETVQTLPPTQIQVSWWQGQVTVPDFCWQKGDTVTITLNDVSTFVVQNAPEPTQRMVFSDNEDGLKHTVSGNTIKLVYDTMADADYTMAITITRSAQNMVGYAVSDDESTYPNDGIHTDGFFYKRTEIVNTEGMFCWMKSNEIPEMPIGYTKLESLTTGNSVYFDSGYLIEGTSYTKLKIVADVAISTATNNWRVSGTGSTSPIVYIGMNQSGQYAYGNGASDVSTGIGADTNRHTYTLDFINKKYTVDNAVNVTIAPGSGASRPRNFTISAYDAGSGATSTTIHIETIYSYSFYEYDTLVKRLIPALDIEGKPCLYDTVGRQAIYAIGGNPTAGTQIGVVKADNYVLSDNLNAYPQEGYHTDGYYYKLLESDIAWDERGRYAWSKNEVKYGDGEVTFPTLASASLSPTTGGYSMTSTGGGWGTSYLISEEIDISKHKITFDFTLAATGSERGIFFGIADTKATTYTSLNHSTYIHGSNAINHWRKGSQVANHGYISVGDKITMTVEGSTMTVYRNGSALFTDTTVAFTKAYVCIVLYQSAVYGTINCKMSNCPVYVPIGYVVGNEENAYPNDALADDSYWYQKVGATKVSPKYASGKTNAVSAKVTVTGLGFKPHAVMMDYSTTIIAYGVVDEASGKVTAYSKVSSNATSASTFVPNDDGFEFTGANFSTYAFNWYAIGY